MGIESHRQAFGDRGALALGSESRELVEAPTDPGELAEHAVALGVLLRLRDGAERRLADKPRRRAGAGAGALGNARELLSVEANQLGGSAALGRRRLAMSKYGL